jgi:hypothetical protein
VDLREVKPQVFAGLYPLESNQFEALRTALEKLSLNDSSLRFEPENSTALGFGFRCGFFRPSSYGYRARAFGARVRYGFDYDGTDSSI